MKRTLLTDAHPIKAKLDVLMAYAEKIGLTIDFSHCSSDRTFVTDNETGEPFYLEDVDNGRAIKSFPAPTEYKLVKINQPEVTGK